MSDAWADVESWKEQQAAKMRERTTELFDLGWALVYEFDAPKPWAARLVKGRRTLRAESFEKLASAVKEFKP